jgi:NAD-dependent DNA ligase
MSEEAGTEERIEELRKSVARHGQLCDQEGQPEISDSEYGKLLAELETLGKELPETGEGITHTLRTVRVPPLRLKDTSGLPKELPVLTGALEDWSRDEAAFRKTLD